MGDEIYEMCIVPTDRLLIFKWRIFHVLVGLVFFLNVLFGAIFSFKLSSLVGLHNISRRNACVEEDSSANGAQCYKMKALIVKNNILTFAGCISTISFYVLYVPLNDSTVVRADAFVNCLIVGLMFSYNQNHYQRLCGPCNLLYDGYCCPNEDAVKQFVDHARIRTMSIPKKGAEVAQRVAAALTPTTPNSRNETSPEAQEMPATPTSLDDVVIGDLSLQPVASTSVRRE